MWAHGYGGQYSMAKLVERGLMKKKELKIATAEIEFVDIGL